MRDLTSHRSVCVVGFGRSGTSLTMRILHTLGVAVGPDEDLLAPHAGDNPHGYWEPTWMVDLNDEILGALGTTWWQPFPGQPGWENSPTLDALRERAMKLYSEKLGRTSLGGWKDPRTSLTLPLWQTFLKTPLYVVCIRNPVDAIASIQRRPEPTLSTFEWGDMWLEYTARALQATSQHQRVMIFYDDYFQRPSTPVGQLADLLGLDAADPRIHAAQPLVEADLRHHRTSPLELAAAPGLSAEVRTAFLALRASHDLRQLSDRHDNAQVCDALEKIIIDIWCSSREARRLQVHAKKQADDAMAAAAGLLELESKLMETQSQLDELFARVTHQEQELAALRASASWRMTAPLRALKRRTVEAATHDLDPS